MTKNGIDVSYAQNNVDWQKVKASGVDFAIVRVGWCYNNGALKEDVHFKKHISGALAAGLDVGVYLYSYATTAEAARRAAKEVIEAVKPYKLSYPIAFDIEYESIYTGGSKQVNTDICKAFLDEIEAALDDSNVTRFAQYLHKLTKNTQFIVITHRRGTMTAADRLYGITMQEKGVSTLVSVDLLEDELTK